MKAFCVIVMSPDAVYMYQNPPVLASDLAVLEVNLEVVTVMLPPTVGFHKRMQPPPH